MCQHQCYCCAEGGHCCCCHVVNINMGEGGDEGEGDTLSPLDDNNVFVVVVVVLLLMMSCPSCLTHLHDGKMERAGLLCCHVVVTVLG